MQRVAKILELANVKLGSVVTDIMGVTGRPILEAMIRGKEDPEVLAGLARGSLVRKRAELAEAVPGLIRDHHRFLLRNHLGMIDYLSERIEDMDQRIGEATRPYSAALELLESIPEVATRSAEAILAETGDDMTNFPTSGHFASWARVCPGTTRERGEAKIGVDGVWERVVESRAVAGCLWAAVRTRGSYYRALYHRHKARGGPKKAIRGRPARDPGGGLAHVSPTA